MICILYLFYTHTCIVHTYIYHHDNLTTNSYIIFKLYVYKTDIAYESISIFLIDLLNNDLIKFVLFSSFMAV